MKTGKTNRLICKLYPLEISTMDINSSIDNSDRGNDNVTGNDVVENQILKTLQRPQRTAAAIAKLKIQDTFNNDDN